MKGQRHNQGWWWSATTGQHNGYESWLERDVVMMLDFRSPVAYGAIRAYVTKRKADWL